MPDYIIPAFHHPKYWHDQKIAFLAHPRTASTSTRDALLKIGFHDNPLTRPRLSHHTRLSKKLSPDWIVFTTVRNHYDTIISWYFKDNVWKDQPLNVEWLDRFLGSEDEIHDWVGGKRLWSMHLPFTTHILRFENIQQDLNDVLALRGLGPAKMQLANVSTHRHKQHYTEVFDKKTRRYVYDRFGEEMEELGYHWELP